MNDELSPAENVNTKRLAAMQKLRRMHEAGQVDRRHSIYAIASGVVMLLFMVLTVLGTRFEWRAQTMWEVGMWLGVSTAMFIGMLAMRFIWPFYASIIDWERAAPLPADAGEDETRSIVWSVRGCLTGRWMSVHYSSNSCLFRNALDNHRA